MTPTELTSRVTRDTCVLGAVLAAPAAWLAGSEGAVGAAAGVGLAVGNFRWLAARVPGMTGTATAARSLWSLGAGLRFAIMTAACAGLLASGWAHPVALVAGLTLLPGAVLAHGLRAAREEI